MISVTNQEVKLNWLRAARPYFLTVLGLIAAIVLLWSISTAMDYISRPTFQKFGQAIGRELPPGVSPQQVQAFLRQYDFRYSEKLGLVDKTRILINPHGEKLKGKEDGLVYYVTGYGHVANWRLEMLCGCGRAQVDFYFDEQQKLVEYVAYEDGDAS